MEQRPRRAHERHTGAVWFRKLPVIIVHLRASGLKHTGREDVLSVENARDFPGGPVVKNPPCMMTQRDVMGREVGGGFMFGNACTPVVD